MTTLTCSSCSSTGHGERLSGRTSRWRSGTARCLTYASQWTSWETSVASCPACTPCQAVTPSPTLHEVRFELLMNNDIGGLQYVPREPDISQRQLKPTGVAFFLALCGQKETDSLNTARYVHGSKETTATKEAATDRQQPATTRAPNPSLNDALDGSRSAASTGRLS